MKEKIIIILIITIYSTITTPFIKNHSEKNIEIAIADDIWDYFSRFRINN